jgi:alkanesulfonate monooxygenase SsuD/methylene tetrahydromethanopterin reductase-like flavin-dependent oxidoreductase (luciferase family)
LELILRSDQNDNFSLLPLVGTLCSLVGIVNSFQRRKRKNMEQSRRGYGVFGGIPVDLIRSVAQNADDLGYDSFWANSGGPNDGLAGLAQAASVTARINLGVGVIPLTSRSPESIAAAVVAEALPLNRLLLGVGSPNPGALQRVREGVRELRSSLDAKIFVAALGPKMCRLAGEVADGVLFNWLTPEYARMSAEWVREAAVAAGRPAPALYAYQRVALGPSARERLAQEGARYAGIPQYADHFARMGVTPLEASVASDTVEGIQAGLAQWDGILDEIVVRGIVAAETVNAYLDLLRAAAPR